MACLLEAKQLCLAPLQRTLRARIVRERKVLHEVTPERLMDWRQWQRPSQAEAADRLTTGLELPAAKRARTSYKPVTADDQAFRDAALR